MVDIAITSMTKKREKTSTMEMQTQLWLQLGESPESEGGVCEGKGELNCLNCEREIWMDRGKRRRQCW